MKNLIIIGTGGHAKVVTDAVRLMNCFNLIGFVDKNLKEGSSFLGVKVLGDDNFLDQLKDKEVFLSIAVGAVRADALRKNLFTRFSGYEFANIIHPTSIIAEGVVFGDGVQVLAGSIINTSTQISDNVIINTGAIIEHDCKINSHVHIAPGSVIGGGAEIGECSMVGLGAKILPGIKIGKNVTIGSGAVVTRDVDNNIVVVGVPAYKL